VPYRSWGAYSRPDDPAAATFSAAGGSITIRALIPKTDHPKRSKFMAKATASQEACEQLKTEIQAGGDFAALAKQHSQCPSGKQGGDLGQFGPGQMVKEFDAVVFSAPIGEVQGPVKTQFGYHLIEITQRTA
jgi:peptidyl-prolyl cis-trans isomerase C